MGRVGREMTLALHEFPEPLRRRVEATAARSSVGSSLTSVDLAGLTGVELTFALLLTAGADGLVFALGLAERRRSFAIAAALGAAIPSTDDRDAARALAGQALAGRTLAACNRRRGIHPISVPAQCCYFGQHRCCAGTRSLGGIPKLTAQRSDVNIQGLGGAEPIGIPHVRHQVLAADRDAGLSHEPRKQIELAGSKGHFHPADEHSAGSKVTMQGPEDDRTVDD